MNIYGNKKVTILLTYSLVFITGLTFVNLYVIVSTSAQVQVPTNDTDTSTSISPAPSTPTVTSTATTPSPTLKFIPQDAYIQTVTPPQVAVQQQQSNNSGTATIESIVTAGIGSAIAYFTASMRADKKHKENVSEILKGKETTKELARVTYDMNPEAAAKIDDAPTVKNETLSKDVQEYGQIAAKK